MAALSDDSLAARVARLEAARAEDKQAEGADKLATIQRNENLSRRIKTLELNPSPSSAVSPTVRAVAMLQQGPLEGLIDRGLQRFKESLVELDIPDASTLSELLLQMQIVIGVILLDYDRTGATESWLLIALRKRVDELERLAAETKSVNAAFQ